MTIKTTIYIDSNLFEDIESIAKTNGLSKNEIITHILKKFVKSKAKRTHAFGQVKYQPRKKECEWKKLHISLPPVLYDQCQELRSCLKLSISFFFSLAYKKYKDSVHNNKEKSDNNYSQHHIYISRIYNDTPYYIVYWGYPGEQVLEKALSTTIWQETEQILL